MFGQILFMFLIGYYFSKNNTWFAHSISMPVHALHTFAKSISKSYLEHCKL